MISFPNCKVNLGLHIVEKRSDGYHNLETVFYPLPLTDILEIIPAAGNIPNATTLSTSGLPVAGEPASNLCLKAWHLLKKDFPELPAVQMHLHKKIPMGAGLGGGSADGAFALKQLNQLFNLGISNTRLAAYALSLGSDCPFFIYNSPMIAKGRGEIMEPINLHLESYSWLIVNPKIHIGTAQAFSRVVPSRPTTDLNTAIGRPISEWDSLLKNDFETSAFYYYPDLRKVKQWLYEKGALYASMSGSGSCFYGLFPKNALPSFSELNRWEFYAVT